MELPVGIIIGRMGQCEECMHLQEISKIKYYRNLEEVRHETHMCGS